MNSPQSKHLVTFLIAMNRGLAMSPDEMRAKAQECEDKARVGISNAAAEMHLNMARRWRELANDIENYQSVLNAGNKLTT